MRKIIQIAIEPATERYDYTTMYALCDDGSVWFMNVVDDQKIWRPSPSIWQPEDVK